MRTARTSNSKELQQKYRLGTVSNKILGGLNRFYGNPTSPSASAEVVLGKYLRQDVEFDFIGSWSSPFYLLLKRTVNYFGKYGNVIINENDQMKTILILYAATVQRCRKIFHWISVSNVIT